MPRYFKKELVSNHIIENGSPIRFQPIGGNIGVIELDEERDKALIAVLDSYADRRKLGVVRISAEVADTLKKKAASIKSPPAPGVLQRLRVADRDLLPKRPKDALATSSRAGRAASDSQPVNVPANTPPPAPKADVVPVKVPRVAPKSTVENNVTGNAAIPA